MKKNVLSAADILGVEDCKLKEVKVPEWGGSVYLKVMSGADRNPLEQMWMNADQTPTLDLAVQLLVVTLVDADGNRLFNEEQAKGLVNKNAVVLQRLMNEAFKHNGMDAESLETAVKN